MRELSFSYHVFITEMSNSLVSIDQRHQQHKSDEDEEFIFQQRLEYQSYVLEELSGLTEKGV